MFPSFLAPSEVEKKMRPVLVIGPGSMTTANTSLGQKSRFDLPVSFGNILEQGLGHEHSEIRPVDQIRKTLADNKEFYETISGYKPATVLGKENFWVGDVSLNLTAMEEFVSDDSLRFNSAQYELKPERSVPYETVRAAADFMKKAKSVDIQEGSLAEQARLLSRLLDIKHAILPCSKDSRSRAHWVIRLDYQGFFVLHAYQLFNLSRLKFCRIDSPLAFDFKLFQTFLVAQADRMDLASYSDSPAQDSEERSSGQEA